MEIVPSQVSPQKLSCDCLVLGFFSDKSLKSQLEDYDKSLKARLEALHKAGDLKTTLKSHLLLVGEAGNISRYLILGLGKSKDWDERALHSTLEVIAQAIKKAPVKNLALDIDSWTPEKKSALSFASLSARMIGEQCYVFERFKSKTKPHDLKKIILTSRKLPATAFRSAIQTGNAIQKGMQLTRDLANTPPNHCPPKAIAAAAKGLSSKKHKVTVKVLSRPQIQKLKMGAFLSVAKASAEPPFFIELQYRGGKPKDKPIVLIGKGITFDTGGNSLKPGASMVGMKFDMCGAATVLGVFQAVSQLGLKINLVGLIPTCENMIGGNAMRPDDVVTSMSGKTIEVLNTDAEGRLILCDAMTYAERFAPTSVITIATLTGACVATFGSVTSGLLSNHQPLAQSLLDASLRVYDKAWQLPLWPEYQPLLNSPVADIANIGGPSAGTITSACFLSRFAEKYHWAHLDIAGTAYTMGSGKKNASGRPIPLLVEFLTSQTEYRTYAK